MSYLWTDTEWTWKLLHATYNEIEKIAIGEMGLDIYPNSLEIISSEQMLDAYSSIGMPVFYKHWSFGKHFTREKQLYSAGFQGLAYEIVINSNPCVSYLMEENTMTMQALVIAHAAFGHNHFFKNNAMYRMWTDASSIIDYLIFARDYIAKCEEREGHAQVEVFLDSCHALMNYGVNRFKRPSRLSATKEKERQKERDNFAQARVSELFDRLLKPTKELERYQFFQKNQKKTSFIFVKNTHQIYPNGNERSSVSFESYRNISILSHKRKICNEGCATYVHYRIMQRLHVKEAHD